MARHGHAKRGVAAAVLCLVVTSCCGARVPLDLTAYNSAAACAALPAGQSCWQFCLQLAFTTVYTQITDPANCLRLSFHDAGTYNNVSKLYGANGSILKELNASANAGLTPCGSQVAPLAAQIRSAGCPISLADTIQVMALASVSMTGGPVCPLLLGRVDSATADSTAGLPSECFNAQQLTTSFNFYGMKDPILSLVVLSGAHNIGKSTAHPKTTCSKGLGPLTQTANSFDGHYYVEIVNKVGKSGWFTSDRALSDATLGATTRMMTLMKGFAADPASFAAKGPSGATTSPWCVAFQEMGLLGVDPAPFTTTSGSVPTAPGKTTPPKPPQSLNNTGPKPPQGQNGTAAKPLAPPMGKPPVQPASPKPAQPPVRPPVAAPAGKPPVAAPAGKPPAPASGGGGASPSPVVAPAGKPPAPAGGGGGAGAKPPAPVAAPGGKPGAGRHLLRLKKSKCPFAI